MTLKEAAHDLYEHFKMPRHPYWVQCIGIAEVGTYNDTDRIVVFLNRRPMHHEGSVPETWHGFPVECKVIGPIAPLGKV